MKRSILTSVFIATACTLPAQTKIISLGIFTGGTTSFTYDEGIYKDSRYRARYDVKFAPIGLAYGMDFDGFGFILTPSLIKIGQNFHVINTVGGQVGERKIEMQYLNVPIGLKLHMIDMSFFKVSAIGSVSFAYLLNGKESISHQDSKLRFPPEVYPILPADYIVEYDGVLAPEVSKLAMLSKSDFKPMQVFIAVGLRSDWDLSDAWRVSFDFRVNYGIFETRTDSYLEKLNTYQTLYDIPGNRREFFGYLNIGVARYIEIEKKVKEQKKKIKGSPKPFIPKNYPWPKPRNSKPKN